MQFLDFSPPIRSAVTEFMGRFPAAGSTGEVHMCRFSVLIKCDDLLHGSLSFSANRTGSTECCVLAETRGREPPAQPRANVAHEVRRSKLVTLSYCVSLLIQCQLCSLFLDPCLMMEHSRG